ncbi:MAG TPA: SCO1664 family protein [Jiangellaceae bacterium]|nr:SCO1664 family protein [Jiangellaceae bacterium]
MTDPVLAPLRDGELAVDGRLVDATNATLLCTIVRPNTSDDGGDIKQMRCVYKPIAGERPLWDFPDGTLGQREVAAFLVSEAAGWHVVPPTVFRDGPFGPGMCQLWVDRDGTALVHVVPPDRIPAGWMRVLDAVDGMGKPVVLTHADDPRLRRMALFDVVVNNADRKGGHVLVDGSGAVHGVDHGVCFHPEPKLRTVLWGWGGRPLTDDERRTLRTLLGALDGELGVGLGDLLSAEEIDATGARVEDLLRVGRLPRPNPVWPPIPWPPF